MGSNGRTRKPALAWTLAATLAVAAAAADVFQDYGLDRQAWAEAFVGSMTTNPLWAPSLPAKLKSVPPAQRAAVVNALGAAAKAFVATPEFKAQYKKAYEAKLPDDLRPPRSAKDIEAGMRADMEKGLAEMEEAVKGFQGEIRKQAEAGLAQMRAEMKEQLKTIGEAAAQQAADEKARYDAARSRPPDPDALSPDPRAALRKSLKAFLDDTAGVDFAAQLKTQSGLRRFVRDDYEAKPRPWKMCYRAGREACDAARAFATNWLAELK
jgi:hypothetical protein